MSEGKQTTRPRLGIATAGSSFEEDLLFERSREGARGTSLPVLDVPEADPTSVIPSALLRDDLPGFPEVSEPEVVRHFTRLSTWNAAVDLAPYPLGSCTMKYNPKLNERVARLDGLAQTHPLQPPENSQGLLQLMYELADDLAEIGGFNAVSLQPAAGAQGEMTGVMLIRAYHEARGDKRTKVLIPDTAHGTNPASAAINGYEAVTIPSGEDGILHPEEVAKWMTPEVAALMITNPNTLGIFEEHLPEISRIVHERGGLVYGDGANLNALMGIACPGDLGVDVMHFNLHKTFSTPHGGGGPGAGPVGVKAVLEPFLPRPVVGYREEGNCYFLDEDRPQSIGRLHGNLGNVGVMVRAYAYIRLLGAAGLRRSTEMAVLNANYLLARLRERFTVAAERPMMHECVFSDKNLAPSGVSTMDVAKRLIDYGYHPPTTYFPLIVHGALMIEPTESESRAELDAFADALLAIEEEARSDPGLLHAAPLSTRVDRLDEARAARKPVLRWTPEGNAE